MSEVFDTIGKSDEELNQQPSTFDMALQEPNVPPINAQAQAAQVAIVESQTNGEEFDKALDRNRYDFQINDSQVIRNDSAKRQGKVGQEMDDQIVADQALQGDVQGAVDTVQAANTNVTHEDTVVAALAPATTPGERLLKYSKRLEVGNMIGDLAAKAERDKIPYLDGLFSIIHSIFLPGQEARTNANIVEKALGVDLGNAVTKTKAATEPFVMLRDKLSGMSPEQQQTFLSTLYDIAQEESGYLFDNSYEVEQFMNKITHFTTTDAEFQNVFTGVDTVTYPAALAGLAAKALIKGSNAVVAKSVGNKLIASQALARDIMEKTEISGLPEAEQIAIALKAGKNPFNHTAGIMDGLEDDVKKQLSDFAARKDLAELIDLTGPTGFTPEEWNQMAANVKKGYDDFYNSTASPHIKSFETTDVDDTGALFTVTYKPKTKEFFADEIAAKGWAKKNGIENPKFVQEEDGWYIKQDIKHEFTAKDAEGLKYNDNTHWWNQWIPSPARFPLQTASREAVVTRILGVHQEDLARKHWEKLFKGSVKGLNKKSENKVFGALHEASDDGSGIGKVYSNSDLEMMQFTPQEKAAYYKLRMLRDSMHVVHDKALAGRLRYLGFNEVNYVGDAEAGFKTAGKVLEEEQVHAAAKNGEFVVLDMSGKTPEKRAIPRGNIGKMLKDDYKFIKISDGKMLNGEQFDTILVKGSDVDLKNITSVLPYRPGEYSRVYTDAYFVTATQKGWKNGAEGLISRTIRTAATKGEAEAYVKGLNEAMRILRYAASPKGAGFTGTDVIKAMGKYTDNPRELMDLVKNDELSVDAIFNLKFDREAVMGSSEHTDSVLEHMFDTGRLFTSKRGERLKNVFGEDAPIKTPKQAMAQEMSYLSRFANIAVWRESQIDKFLNTYKHAIEYVEGGTKYEQAFNAPLRPGISTAEIRNIKTLRNHLRTQFGIPSQEALSARQKMIENAAWLEGHGLEKLSKFALDFRASSPTQFLRTAVFHGYLGMMNLAQFVVQANGAVIASAIHPIYGLKAAMSFPALRFGLIAKTLNNDAGIKAMAKFSGMGEKEFVDTIDLIHKSGILNSIKSSALHYVKEGAVDLDTHLVAFTSGPKQAIKKTGHDLANLGMAPFNRGEEFSRIVAFDISRREWMKANPGRAITSRHALDEILARQEELTLGMSRANIGRVQQGIASVPFQFVQYNWKLAQSMLGRTFTASEKARILGGMAMVYGANGMGLDWLFDEVFGGQNDQMSKGAKIAYTEGIVSGAIYAATGAETGLGTRVGPLKYWADLVKKTSSGELSVAAAFTGPSGSFLKGTQDLYNEVFRIFNTDGVDLGDKTEEVLFEVLRTYASSWRNASKYLIQPSADGYLRSRRGQAIAKITPAEGWWAVLGFGSMKEYEAWDTSSLLREAADTESDYANTLTKLYNKYYTADTNADADKYYKQIASFTNSIPAGMRFRVGEKALHSLQRESVLQQNILKIEKRMAEGSMTEVVQPDVNTEGYK
jgi:hypothetical protein